MELEEAMEVHSLLMYEQLYIEGIEEKEVI
jgi:hypothetical protein